MVLAFEKDRHSAGPMPTDDGDGKAALPCTDTEWLMQLIFKFSDGYSDVSGLNISLDMAEGNRARD